MKIAFLYTQQNTVFFRKPLRGQEEMSFGISYIASLLEKHGHSTELLVFNRASDHKNRRYLLKYIQTTKPDLICFSAVFSEYTYQCSLAAYIKSVFPDLFLLLGGVHITLNPSEDALEIFDGLCLGEGEYPVLELTEKLEQQLPVTGIPNLWLRTASGIEKNEVRPFISDLDKLPFPHREMWQPWILNRETRLTLLLGRGCPFNCTYCCNHSLRKVAKGDYVRLRSPENIILELEELNHRFPSVRNYFLEVETLGIDLQWLENLCRHLQKFNSALSHPLSFSANLRIYPGLDTEKVFQLLEDAGFDSVIIGLESGNEMIRKKILNRNYSNEAIIQAVNAARRHHIRIGIFNLIGLPEETPQLFQETLIMNQKIQPDWHATSIFYPYPGTDLFQKIKTMGLTISPQAEKNERQIARISYPGFTKREIQSAFDSFHLKVYRKRPKPGVFKTGIYFIQSWLGHHTLAQLKLLFIRMLYLSGLDHLAKKWGLFGLFQ